MKPLILFFALTLSILAGDTVMTINRPQYLGGGAVTTVQSGGTSSKVIVTPRPSYLGGGSNIKVTTGSTTSTATSTVKPVYLGGGSTIKTK